MPGEVQLITLTAENLYEHKLCGQNNLKHEGYKRKTQWLKERFQEGLVYKVLHSGEEGDLGIIEYMPSETCWRPVEAPGYLVIHCLVNMKKKAQGHGYGKIMLNDAIQAARDQGKVGVCAVTSKNTFMASSEIFTKHGFKVVEEAPPCFQLVALRFNESNPWPTFPGEWEAKLYDLGPGLTILRSDQCAYSVKNVQEIVDLAKENGLEPRVIDIENGEMARAAPSAYGTFAIVWDGRLIADHPISKGRFKNILRKEMGTCPCSR